MAGFRGAIEKLRAKGLDIDPQAFLEDFYRISMVGWVEGYGANRLALTEDHINARKILVERLEAIGAKVSIDGAGNIMGEIGDGDEAISIGSHLDSIPGGGRFDGVYGVIAGLEILRAVVRSGLKLKYRLKLIDFNAEEGSRWSPPLLGSGLSTGAYEESFAYQRIDRDGVSFIDALARSGFLGDPRNNLSKNPPKYYVELHIEQGPELHSGGYDIGIPQGIVGLKTVEIVFKGRQDHASSPSYMRKDSLIGLSKVALRLREYTLKNQDRLRTTIGYLDLQPGRFNVVPGYARFTIDLRSYEPRYIEETSNYISKLISSVAEEEGLEYSIKELWYIDRIVFDKEVVETIEASCSELGFKCKKMWSWAGHDAQHMARISRVGMIFVPSINGISHSKDEYTPDEDLIKGLLLLANVIVELNKK